MATTPYVGNRLFEAKERVVNKVPPAFTAIPTHTVDVTKDVLKQMQGYVFEPFYHPYMELVLETLNRDGFDAIFGLLDINDRDTDEEGKRFKQYQPNTTGNPDLLVRPGVIEEFTFDIKRPASKDNWFTFYHLVVLIVETLLSNSKYDEAIQWIEHCLYNPKAVQAQSGAQQSGSNAKFWQLPIFKNSTSEDTVTFFNSIDQKNLQNLIGELNRNPFNPFAVAYSRPQEFMMYVVYLYVKAHIGAGDANFRIAYNGGGMDFLNLALEYYKVAKIQLGDRPETIPSFLKKKPESYATLKEKGLDAAWNTKVQFENIFPFCSQVTLETGTSSSGSLLGDAFDFYFSIPPDMKILELHNIIDTRLSYLRSCKDIDGIVRKIDLFGTPINPEQLLAALAKGLSLGEVLGNLYAPAPLYRFGFLLQKAIEVCNEVRTMGTAIVGAIERHDSAYLEKLRSDHEIDVLNRLTPIKERQLLDSKMQGEGLSKSRDTAVTRLEYYKSLLGSPMPQVPPYVPLPPDVNADTTLPPDTALTAVSPTVDVALFDVDGGVKIISKEKQELDSMNSAAAKHDEAGNNELIAAILHCIPDFSVSAQPVGVGYTFAGVKIAEVFSALGRQAQNAADNLSHESVIAAKFAGYIRREQEWAFQANLAEREIVQLDKQLASADLRIQIAEKELDNHKNQIDNALAIQDFLINKDSNFVNYQSIVDKLKPIHKNLYNLALYYARSAERAYQFEKPEKTVDFISYEYDDSIVGCATVADGLHESLREMEKSYLSDCIRPHEVKITIQLSRLDPLALIQLRKTGSATFRIPEWLLLQKNRGFYNAKWISLNWTFQAIVGGYVNQSAVVSLQKNMIRLKPEGRGGATSDFEISMDGTDDRGVENQTPFREIIVSAGLNDPGYNLDQAANSAETYQQQYHPFVNAGFISEWRIDINKTESYDDKSLDYSDVNLDSLADVILSGVISVDRDSGQFREDANRYLKTLFANAQANILAHLIDIKHDLSGELYRFTSGSAPSSFSFSLDKSRFPYIVEHNLLTLNRFVVVTTDDLSKSTGPFGQGGFTFQLSGTVGYYKIFSYQKDNGTNINVTLDDSPVDVAFQISPDKASESFVILGYTLRPSV